jgi:hypothetical protein
MYLVRSATNIYASFPKLKISNVALLTFEGAAFKCDILDLTTDFSVSFNYGFEAAMMY